MKNELYDFDDRYEAINFYCQIESKIPKTVKYSDLELHIVFFRVENEVIPRLGYQISCKISNEIKPFCLIYEVKTEKHTSLQKCVNEFFELIKDYE